MRGPQVEVGELAALAAVPVGELARGLPPAAGAPAPTVPSAGGGVPCPGRCLRRLASPCRGWQCEEEGAKHAAAPAEKKGYDMNGSGWLVVVGWWVAKVVGKWLSVESTGAKRLQFLV